MRRFLICAAVVFGAAGPAWAGAFGEQPINMPAPYRPLSSGGNLNQFQSLPPLRPMAHRWGFGLDSLPGVDPAGAGSSLVAQPNAVDLRWWATDSLAVDLMAAGTASSAAGSGPVEAQGYGGGLGLKYNLSEPSRDLLVQVLAKGSYATAQPLSGTGGATGPNDQLATVALFLGVGFEAFVPGWDWLSVEGSAGAGATKQDLNPGAAAGAAAGPVRSTTTVGLGGNGFAPVNLSIHVYF
jgi:hypothetical protein